jgi:hypothetical protein
VRGEFEPHELYTPLRSSSEVRASTNRAPAHQDHTTLPRSGRPGGALGGESKDPS